MELTPDDRHAMAELERVDAAYQKKHRFTSSPLHISKEAVQQATDAFNKFVHNTARKKDDT